MYIIEDNYFVVHMYYLKKTTYIKVHGEPSLNFKTCYFLDDINNRIEKGLKQIKL